MLKSPSPGSEWLLGLAGSLIFSPMPPQHFGQFAGFVIMKSTMPLLSVTSLKNPVERYGRVIRLAVLARVNPTFRLANLSSANDKHLDTRTCE